MYKMEGRKRNFTEYEKSLLASCVRNFKDVVENKKTDGATVKMKVEAWTKIADEYNSSQINEKGTVKQLQRLWTNLKQQQRGELAKVRLLTMMTGGGCSAEVVHIDPIVAMVAPNLVVKIPGTIDSNSTPPADIADTEVHLSGQIADEVELQDINCISISPSDSYPVSVSSDLTPSVRSGCVKQKRVARNGEMFKDKLLEAEAKERIRRTVALIDLDATLYAEKVLVEQAKRAEAETCCREANAKALEAETRAEIAVLELQQLKKKMGIK